eukprot:TRINITY_DN33811_c0_g1_i1.p1 TRINITY_DN33811_c0_g1~~TRINITY_DN33811_c0_g1_i1.p1  ORF type:complete len:961 (-),score=176.73 TRINITY_DN33811_c0_g1_i1:246-3128(-)
MSSSGRSKSDSKAASTSSRASEKSSTSKASKSTTRSDSPVPTRRGSGELGKDEKAMRAGPRRSEIGGGRTFVQQEKARTKPAVPVEKNDYTELPKLKDIVDEAEKEALSLKKVKLCCQIYDFNADTALAEKEGKRQTLWELVEYVGTKDIQLSEPFVKNAIEMCGVNIFRALFVKERSPLDIIDPEDDEPYLDKAWPHLEVAYEFLLRLVSVKDLDPKVATKPLNQAFLGKMLVLFDSDDSRERDYLKMISQKIYSKFVGLRTGMRRSIQNACLKVAYENEMQNGVVELLDIMQNIINGFKVPLKAEHKDLLHKVLLPLHKVRSLPFFHSSLMHCMTQYAEKDARLVAEIVRSILALWPNSMAVKEVLFLDEVEELLNLTKSQDWSKMQDKLVKQLSFCIMSPHSQVSERALAFWKNDMLARQFNINRKAVYPIMIKALYRNVRQHWHAAVNSRTFEVLKMLVETDHDLFDDCSANNRKSQTEEENKEVQRTRKWAKLQDLFEKKGGAAAAARESQSRRVALLANGQTCELMCRRSVQILTKEKYGVGVSYERGKAPAELTIQAVIVDEKGALIDGVFDDRIKALEGAVFMEMRTLESVLMSGGAATSDTLGKMHEMAPVFNPSTRATGRASVIGAKCAGIVWAHLHRLPATVRMVVFFVTSYNKGHIKDTVAPMISIVDESGSTFLAQFPVETSSANVGAVAVFRRLPMGTWTVTRVDEFPKSGRHFMDMIEPSLGNLVRNYIPGAPKRLKVGLSMPCGAIATLPSALSTKWLFVGVGWDLAPAAFEGVALEVCCILIDADMNEVAVVTAEDHGKHGIRHGGNSVLSAGMTIDLDAVPPKVMQMLIVGHIVSDDQTFIVVQHPHCRVIDRNGMELARCETRERSHKSSLVMARLYREVGKKRWGFQAILSFICEPFSQIMEAARPLYEQSARGLMNSCEEELQQTETAPVTRKRQIVSL